MSYTALVGQERFKWIEEQYEKWRGRKGKLVALFVSGWIELFGGAYLLPFLPQPAEIRSVEILIVAAIGIVSIFGSMRLFDKLPGLLPPVEDRVLHFLTPALVNLKAYVSNWREDDRKRTLKNVKNILDVLDGWDTGNLKFVKDGVGKTVSDLKENFRGRVIPAFEKPPVTTRDKQRIVLLQLWLSNTVHNQLEMGQLQELHVKGWSRYLTLAENPNDVTSPPQFPYKEPNPSKVTWLKSRWVHLAFIVSVPLAPAVLYSLAISTQLASRDTAFNGAILLSVALIASYTTYRTIGRQKKS